MSAIFTQALHPDRSVVVVGVWQLKVARDDALRRAEGDEVR
jgi:hypothetical protein